MTDALVLESPDLRYYWGVIARGKYLIAITTALVVGIVLV